MLNETLDVEHHDWLNIKVQYPQLPQYQSEGSWKPQQLLWLIILTKELFTYLLSIPQFLSIFYGGLTPIGVQNWIFVAAVGLNDSTITRNEFWYLHCYLKSKILRIFSRNTKIFASHVWVCNHLVYERHKHSTLWCKDIQSWNRYLNF